MLIFFMYISYYQCQCGRISISKKKSIEHQKFCKKKFFPIYNELITLKGRLNNKISTIIIYVKL